MKMRHKLLLLLLTAAMLLCAFGCKQAEEPDRQTTQPETTQAPKETGEFDNYPGTFKEERYSEIRDFEVAVPESDSNGYFCLSCTEDFNGSQVHDSMVRRDSMLYEKHGISVTYNTFPANDNGVTLRQTVQNALSSNIRTSDMIGGGLNYCILPLNDMGFLYHINQAEYVNFDNPWWASYFIDGVAYKGNVNYAAAMALGPGFFGAPYTMICNLYLQNQGIYLPDGTQMDIFELVETGEWTLEVFYDITREYTLDLNHDDKIIPADDRLAYAHIRSFITAGCHYIAAGMKFSSWDEAGNIKVDLTDETVVNCVDRLQGIFDTLKDNWHDTLWDNQIQIFMNGHALFFGNSMTYIANLTQMVADYAIIPLPKGSADQKSYYTGINTWTSAYIAIPRQVEDPEFIGHTLELLGYYAYTEVRPVLYDKIICVRLERDLRQRDIMDTIYGSLYTDLNFIQNFAGSAGIVGNCIMDATQSYATSIAAVATGLPMVLEKYDKDMSKAEQQNQ